MPIKVVLFVGTKRGLFVLDTDEGRRKWNMVGPLLRGREVYHTVLDTRDGQTAWAATAHPVWGSHVHRSSDAGKTWELLEDAPHYDDARGMKAIWHLALGQASAPNRIYAGIEPAGLFISEDRGDSWEPIKSLNDHKTNDTWQPAGGGLALHSILIDPYDETRMFCGISAGGVYRTDDGGATWEPINKGVRADFLSKRYPKTGQCVHKLLMHPARQDRLYQQNHHGTYRSDDCGESWIEISDGLPSDFGYALALDPTDPDTLFVIPEESSEMRATVDGKLRIYCSRDAGGAWRPLTRGLPQENAYVSILREGLTNDTMEPCGLYVGTSSGHLFASRDRGESWQMLASFLPRILSVSVAVLGTPD
jgi:hypothetical protein